MIILQGATVTCSGMLKYERAGFSCSVACVEVENAARSSAERRNQLDEMCCGLGKHESGTYLHGERAQAGDLDVHLITLQDSGKRLQER